MGRSSDTNELQSSAWTLDHLALIAADMGAWTWEIDEDVVRGSPRAHELFDVQARASAHVQELEREEAFGGTLDDFLARIHADDRATVAERIEHALLQGPDEWCMEHRVAGAEPERWLRGRVRLIRDRSGKALRMTGVVEPLGGELRAAEQERRAQAALMQAALDASLFAVVVLEPSGNIIYCNEMAAKLLGLTRSAVRARSYDAPQWKHSDVDGGPWPDEKQPFARVMATKAPVYGIEHRVERPDGTTLVLRINGAPVKDERGEIKLLVFSFEDVTQRRAVEEGFRRAQKMEAIGRLSAGVAHDFNNLLTVILSSAWLAQDVLDRRRELLEYLSNIIDAGERAAALTGQLLLFSRREVASVATFDVREEVTVSARLIERVVGERITVQLEESAEPCWVSMDRGQLHQVLVNLAVNARDAMPSGGRLSVTTTRSAEAGTVRIRVSDTGVGMDEATLRHAFEPFFTTKPQHKGTGLGLATCHDIVTSAGGSISLHSAPGRGTIVTIDLPTAAAPRELPPASSQRVPRLSVGHRRVLVVEDEPAVRMLAVQALRDAGFEVTGTSNAEQALDLFSARSFDILVTDVILPGLSGPELAQRARAQRPSLKVLFVSGYPGEFALDEAQVMAKPYTPDLLRAALARLHDGD